MRLQLTLAAVALTCSIASAKPFDLGTATGLFVPSFRGDANTTWVGWDTFDDNGAGDMIINDQTPDIGTDGGSFVTTNGEDHISGSLNYYSSSGSVAEDITFDTPGDGTGFTTIVFQAQTVFGGFGAEIEFSPIAGVLPEVVNTATAALTDSNALGQGQLFAKYEIADLDNATGEQSFSVSTGPLSLVSLGLVTVDALWSPTAFAPDSAIATPEPAAAALMVVGITAAVALRRRV